MEKRAKRTNGGTGQGGENNVLLVKQMKSYNVSKISGPGKLEFGRFLGKASLSLLVF